ncbi:MAG: glycosyltransferase [Oscillospiraceae bacterium]|nr:glycosyltransferase [Oscillospiraceae bacterium]MDY3065729.1 glycosyltransferase [Oscillospiraceae bacterium]
MKIALFTETYLPYINGVVTHVKALHDGLEHLGHEVLVVTVDIKARHHYIKDGVLYCPAKEMKKLYHFGLASPFSHSRYRMLRDFEPDVIHIHQEFGIGLSGARFAKKLNKPLVYTLHTMYDDYLYYIVPERLTPLLRRIAHRYFRYLGKSATELTGPSMKVQEYFDLCGVHKSVNVVPNPVELDVFNPSNLNQEHIAAIRRQYGVADDETLVSFCGRLGKEKSVDVLLDNWAKCVKPEDKCKLMILGGGPCLSELVEQSKRLGIDRQVIFTDAIPHEELPDYYGACQLYVTASISDTNSISMKEAMATGLPVLHIKDPLNAGQVVDGVNGFIYNNAEEMYALLKQYQAMTEEEKEALTISVVNSVKIFGCEALAKYLIGVYEKAIKEKQEKIAVKKK